VHGRRKHHLGTVQKLLVTRTPHKCSAAKKKLAGLFLLWNIKKFQLSCIYCLIPATVKRLPRLLP